MAIRDAVTIRPADGGGQDRNAGAETDAADELLGQMLTSLAGLDRAPSDAARIDRLTTLERMRGAVAAAQAAEMVEFEESQIAEQRESGVPSSAVGRGIPDQVALARKISPATGSHQLSFARSLVKQMPETRKLLAAGVISERAAQAMVRETAELSRSHRRRVDADLAADLPGMTDRETAIAARRLAYELDPESAVRRGRTARRDRRVSIRPAPDTMALVTGFVPVEQGVAAWASLDKAARTCKANGDPRTRSQIMTDIFVERLTGQGSAAAVPVRIDLTMTAEAFADEEDVAADLVGYGPVPAEMAREMAGAPASDGDAFGDAFTVIRRVFTDPETGTATHVDTRQRRFTGAAARLIRVRDRVCRTPSCGAPIRHLDHIRPHRVGGATSVDNGQGLCERCSYVKETPGWHTDASDTGPHTTTISTPTGHTYQSRPPPTIGDGPPRSALAYRRALRRLEFLKRERLIADLPSPVDTDP